jgi:hypothetical protein
MFVDRDAELARLDAALDKLEAGRAAFLALLGLRKQGKTSLIYEWMRRASSRPRVAFVPMQCWSWPDPDDFFGELLRLTVNAALACTGARSSAGLISAADPRGRLVEVATQVARRNLRGVGDALSLMAEYPTLKDRGAAYRAVVRAPEAMAARDGIRFQIVLDEFQELARLDAFKAVRRSFGSIYAMLREEWQGQKHCNYVVSGSAISMLRQILDEPSAPLFQHFTVVTLGPLPRAAATKMLVDFSRESGTAIPPDLCESMIDLVGTNPYYLQVLGEELTMEAGTAEVTREAWQIVCQRVLLASSGRLYQFFERLHDKMVGSSSMLEKIVLALAEGPRRGAEIARAMGVTQNRIGSKLPMLVRQDAIEKDGDRYRLCDACYGHWLRAARGRESSVIAPLLLGCESEQNVAREMARQGVGLVYQSRASRGAFDLLALYQAHEIGVQVRRIKKYPAYLSERLLGRMRHDAARLGWLGVVAFDLGGRITFHALSAGRRTRRGMRFDEESALRHVLDVV